MYEIKPDEEHAIISLVVKGHVNLEEITRFVEELEDQTLAFAGRELKILADMRQFKPTSSEVASMLQDVQEFGLRNGVIRVAEIVQSAAAAVQLNIVARRSKTDQVLRRFPPSDLDLARQWLITGELPPSEQDE
ncbi:MAG: STAS/SEC14 domain-containing protein [Myxococcales bacterium]|nr:STAS/SEC14 domain-containing protein [Myxococcales bacterium]